MKTGGVYVVPATERLRVATIASRFGLLEAAHLLVVPNVPGDNNAT